MFFDAITVLVTSFNSCSFMYGTFVELTLLDFDLCLYSSSEVKHRGFFKFRLEILIFALT